MHAVHIGNNFEQCYRDSLVLVNKRLSINYHMVKTQNFYFTLTWSWIGTGSWRTDRQNYRS